MHTSFIRVRYTCPSRSIYVCDIRIDPLRAYLSSLPSPEKSTIWRYRSDVLYRYVHLMTLGGVWFVIAGMQQISEASEIPTIYYNDNTTIS